jgi:pullulanase
MGRRFIVDSCRYWVEEYGFDGFRFDLMGLTDFETMQAVRDTLHAIDPTLLIYGEPWAATGPDGMGLGRITDKWTVAGSGIGAFNDHFRDAIKGSPNGTEGGFVQEGTHIDAVKAGIMGSIKDWTHDPTDAVQYVACHDNLTLWDKIDVSCPDAPDEQKLKMQMLAMGILAVSQGSLFLHAGMEFGRSKFGHHNSYNASDNVNRLDWRRKKLFSRIFHYARGLVHMRRAHPVFRLRTRSEVEKRLRFRDDLCPGGPFIAFTLDGTGLEGETWHQAIVLINGSPQGATFRLPDGMWAIYTYGISSEDATIGRMSGKISMPAHTMTILAH